jgi:glucan phosphoethanolaminetransferase (alkaline phosphatase superfamily)
MENEFIALFIIALILFIFTGYTLLVSMNDATEEEIKQFMDLQPFVIMVFLCSLPFIAILGVIFIGKSKKLN